MPDKRNSQHSEALRKEKIHIVLNEKLKAISEETLNAILDNKFMQTDLSISKMTESIQKAKTSASFISSQYDLVLQENKSQKAEVL